MENLPTPTNSSAETFDIPELPVAPDLDPIAELLDGPRVTEMTDEELLAFTKEARIALESPQTLRKLLAAGTKIKKKSSAKSTKPAIDLNATLGLDDL